MTKKYRFIASFGIEYKEKKSEYSWDEKEGPYVYFIDLQDIMPFPDNDNKERIICEDISEPSKATIKEIYFCDDNYYISDKDLENELPDGMNYLKFVWEQYVREGNNEWFDDEVEKLNIKELYDKEDDKNEKNGENKKEWQETLYKGMFDMEVEFIYSQDYETGYYDDESEVINIKCIKFREFNKWEYDNFK